MIILFIVNKITAFPQSVFQKKIIIEMPHFRTEQVWQREFNANSNNHATGDPLSLIYNENQWKLSKVSPLYNLEYSALKLKQYASKIRQSVVSGVATNVSTKYTVQLEELPLLKYSDEDSSGLIITVLSTQGNNTKAKTAYEAILLSWGVNSAVSGATHLPYLLERGEQKMGAAVKCTLQNIFDCNIQPFLFTQHQLLQFGFNFLEYDTSRSSDHFTLTFRTPQIDHKDRVNFTFDVGDVHIIWNGIREEVAKRSELVNLAYQILQNNIFDAMMLDVTVLDLCGITLPKAEIKNSGIVKMKTPEMVNSVFTILNEISDVHKDENIVSNDNED